MPLFEPLVAARYTAPLIEFIAQLQPETLQTILESSQLSLDVLQAPDAILTSQQYEALFMAASRILARPTLSMELGQMLRLNNHQALSHLLRQCKTCNEIMHVQTRYWRLVTTVFDMHYQRHATHAELCIRAHAPMSQEFLFMQEELYAMAFHTNIHQLLGKKVALDVYLSMPRPAHHALYRKFSPTRFHFEAHARPEIVCVMDAALLDLPVQQAKSDSLHRSSPNLQSMPSFARPSSNYAQWVRFMLHEAQGTQPSLNELANLLSISPRTLTRQLAKQNCNLRVLGNTVRHERACAMLLESKLPINQIAFRLGYSDLASFGRAFLATSGTRPRAYRQQHGAA